MSRPRSGTDSGFGTSDSSADASASLDGGERRNGAAGDQMTERSMQRIFKGWDSEDAHMVCGLLKARGLHAVVMGESLSSAIGELSPLGAAPEVWVEEAAMDEAKRAIEEFESQVEPAKCAQCGYDLRGLTEPRCPECGHRFRFRRAPWVCAECGETVEGQFTDCWKCGAAREGEGQE